MTLASPDASEDRYDGMVIKSAFLAQNHNSK